LTHRYYLTCCVQSRWAGTLANTRAFGDAHYKALGVFSEPQLVSTTISGAAHSFLILLSDGVTEKLSDQEICDLARNFQDPSKAAKNIISFAESVGAQDNLTAVIVPLAGWGKIDAPDATKTRREFRLENYEGRSSRQNRM
jgi:protein phosphatase PTC6